MFESRNLSRDSLSREIGRIADQDSRVGTRRVWFFSRNLSRDDLRRDTGREQPPERTTLAR